MVSFGSRAFSIAEVIAKLLESFVRSTHTLALQELEVLGAGTTAA